MGNYCGSISSNAAGAHFEEAVPGIMAVCYQSERFVLMALVYSTMAIFTATQAPIADSYAIVAAKKAGTTYGSIRFMASIGNAVGGYAGGYLYRCYL